MNVCSLEFLAGCCFAPLLFHWLPGKLPRQIFLSALNLAFLWAFVPNPQSWACFALFIGGTYAILWLIRRRPSGLIVFLSISVILAAFLLVKKYTFIVNLVPEPIWDHGIVMIGISYMLFKFIHVLVDTWQGQLESCSLFCYANYQLGFFTLIAGPIQRFNDYHRDWDEMDSSLGDIRQILIAWNRLLTGIIKMGGVASIALYFHEMAGNNWGPQSTSRIVLRFFLFYYSYAFYLYFNFSGYTDIVIGCAQLFGFGLPENFNRPYFARNLVDFWNRWHITLSHWIRDYLFMTTYKKSVERFPKSGKYLGYILLFLALFLAGVWHGSSANFAIFGFIQGLGVMLVQIYGDMLKWILGRPGYQRYLQGFWIYWIAILVTFHYFCFSLLFFAMDAKDVFAILGKIWQGIVYNGGS